MMEATKEGARVPVTIESVLPVVRELSAYDKLVLARILLDQALAEPLLPHFALGTVVELYTPIEIEGITDKSIARFESLLQPPVTSDAN